MQNQQDGTSSVGLRPAGGLRFHGVSGRALRHVERNIPPPVDNQVRLGVIKWGFSATIILGILNYLRVPAFVETPGSFIHPGVVARAIAFWVQGTTGRKNIISDNYDNAFVHPNSMYVLKHWGDAMVQPDLSS